MRGEAKETEERGTEVAGSFDGKKTAILDEAREVKQKAQQMMKTYLDQASDSLDGFEFLTMAEAGEVGHWEILGTLNERAAKARSPSSSPGRCRSSSGTSRRSARRRSSSPRRRIRTRRRRRHAGLAAAALAALALAGCGGGDRPHLARADAAPLIALSKRIASEGRCAQARDIRALRQRTVALVNARRVPGGLRGESAQRRQPARLPDAGLCPPRRTGRRRAGRAGDHGARAAATTKHVKHHGKHHGHDEGD